MRAAGAGRALALAVAVGAAPAVAHDGDHGGGGARDETERPAFALPQAGSYELPPIGRVREHRLVDASGRSAPLLGLGSGRLALVSFVYASCPEAGGCPLALASLQRLDRRLARHGSLGSRVRLVTVSFDPERDTPARMASLRDALDPHSEWLFLTAPDAAALRPVLADFGQDVLPLREPDGAETGRLRHVLKVFLVDASGAVRNIYSAGFLSAELLELDLRTLLLEQGAAGEQPSPGEQPSSE